MTGTIASYALRHRAIVLALTALFTFAGVNAFRHLPVEAYPDVTNVSLQIITLFPGHAAEEVERLVTIPIENQMNGIPQRTAIRSISLFGLSQVTITFEDDANVDFVRNQATQYLAAVSLPAGAQAGLSPNATPVGAFGEVRKKIRERDAAMRSMGRRIVRSNGTISEAPSCMPTSTG